MKIFNSLHQINKNFKKNSITVGNFDGIHKGHQKIIKKCIKVSKKNKLNSAIVTFKPHPRYFFNKNCKSFKLTSTKTKITVIERLGADYLIFLNFNKFLSQLSPEEFIEKILVNKLNVKHLVTGYNFHFGYKRKGNIKLLKKLSQKYDYNLNIVEPVKSKNGIICNSSTIRKNLESGQYDKVKEMLGRAWQIVGKVIRGSGRGKIIGYPTANIKLKDYIIPCKGVYLTESYINGSKKNKKYYGIANIGNRPTFGGNKILLENHFFNIKKFFYGKEICINLIQFLRKEKKFVNTNKLKKQIEIDIKTAKKILKKNK